MGHVRSRFSGGFPANLPAPPHKIHPKSFVDRTLPITQMFAGTYSRLCCKPFVFRDRGRGEGGGVPLTPALPEWESSPVLGKVCGVRGGRRSPLCASFAPVAMELVIAGFAATQPGPACHRV